MRERQAPHGHWRQASTPRSLRLSAGASPGAAGGRQCDVNQKLDEISGSKKLGVDVDCVSNGVRPSKAVMRKPDDAVMLDCQMPEMDVMSRRGNLPARRPAAPYQNNSP